MAHSPAAHDRGTRFTNYSSIHSADAFVGEFQVMYTPGSSPQVNRGVRKSSRFARAVSSTKPSNANQSYILPANMPNTSQLMPEHGALPNIQVQYSIPSDEKQIVASLRSLQRDLDDALKTINELTRERDEALHEIRLLRATSRKTTSPAKKQNMAARVEEELFDLSRSEDSEPEQIRRTHHKKATMEKDTSVSDNAHVLPPAQVNALPTNNDKRLSSKIVKDGHKESKKAVIEDTEQSIVVNEDPTAASNTSRRRHKASLDDNMTSAYILPDITEQRQLPRSVVSKQAQQMLHSLDPEHVANCDVCHRLITKSRTARGYIKSQPQPHSKPAHSQRQQAAKIDYTAAMFNLPSHVQAQNVALLEESYVADPTMRPKIDPGVALARVRTLMQAQFLRAKERHEQAWRKYDAVDAPMDSRKHAGIAKEMNHWSEKMEECRIHLDHLRDVEEGVAERQTE